MNKMNPDCTFCKIVAGNSPATILYRDEQVTAFRDLHPVAPTHILIVPNKHIELVNYTRTGRRGAGRSHFLRGADAG